MNKNNFLLQLTGKDFFEFISSQFDTNGFKESDLTVIKLPVYGDENPPKIKVVLKSSKKFFSKSKPQTMRFYFYSFNYDREGLFSYLHERLVFSSVNEPWRAFMTKKFGSVYIEAYRSYVSEYIKKERNRLEKLNSECDFELEHLKSIITENQIKKLS